jgi:hypothetical protein
MPNDGVPIYMAMDSVKVNVGTGQGVGSHNITDVWIEANADNVGAFELPCNVPVLQENDVRFVVNAGIKESGQSGVRVNYPFYTEDTFSIVGVRGERYKHKPAFRYVNSTQFSFVDDFDFGNGFGPTTNLALVGSPEVDPVWGGSRCMKFSVDAVDSAKEVACTTKYDLPEGQEIWLELDYKAEVPFYVGFYGTFNGSSVTRVPVAFIAQKDTWNKVYVKLSLAVGALRADTYNIYFEALRPYGSTGGSVYIDNVKLVHF